MKINETLSNMGMSLLCFKYTVGSKCENKKLWKCVDEEIIPSIKKSYTIEPYLQIINITDRKNVYSRSYYPSFEGIQMTIKHSNMYQFPMIPFIGVNITW